MPDPQASLGFYHATLPSSNTEYLTYTAAQILPGQQREEESRTTLSDRFAAEAAENNQDRAGADPTTTTLAPFFEGSPAGPSSVYDIRCPYAQVTESQPQVLNTTNVSSASTLNLAQFGSQPWPTKAAPYLAFARQPLFEPTGELVNVATDNFDAFDNPSAFQSSLPQQQTIVTSVPDLIPPTRTISYPRTLSNSERTSLRPALKRNFESASSAGQETGNSGQGPVPELQPRKTRRVLFERMSSANPTSPDDEDSSPEDTSITPSQKPPQTAPPLRGSPDQRRGRRGASNQQPGRNTPIAQSQSASHGTSRTTRGSHKHPAAHPPSILPPEKVFPIQIGSELFRLSGASISSDAPSYFTQFFEEQIKQLEESGGVRTLYIDRDPETFRDVARHLQGYYVKPRDGSHFVKLFADAQFYSLPRLIDLLFESEIYIQIGEKHFQIPKDIFSDPGNSPNFFSLGFAVFFSTPGEVFPGLDRRGLLRPPSITPPYVPGRSAETFAQLLHLLRGYPLLIRNETHRTELLRDCRYFHLRGLEQKIIAHEISYNLQRQKTEICIRIEDVKPSGISYKGDEQDSEEQISSGGWVFYARPFVDDAAYELIVEIGGESTVIDLADMRADFHGLAKARVSSLFQVVANKMNLPTNAPLGLMVLAGGGSSSQSASPGHTPLSGDRVKVRFEPATAITLDGEPYEIDWTSSKGRHLREGPEPSGVQQSDSDIMSEDSVSQTHLRLPDPSSSEASQRSRKRRRGNDSNSGDSREWALKSAQWRLRVQPNPQDAARGGYEIVFVGVKIDAFSNERARNMRRDFLGG